jgi:membrane protease YdiL (CAAX protease family)
MSVRALLKQASGYAGPIALGLLVLVAGIAPWAVMASVNARLRPDLPWAASATFAFLILYVAWLGGAGPPRAWREARRRSLRLWQPGPRAWSREGLEPTFTILAVLAILYLLWILGGGSRQPPDLTPYPTTAYRFSVLIMGAVVSGVTEEVAFRGYMQSRLERYGAARAIVITSIVFMLFHAVHGWQALLLLGPGLLIASALYGMLAYHTGSILPGMAAHAAGDMAFTYFGFLGGDWRLLFAT